MSGQPRRCPNCLNAMPLARRRCPYCQVLLPVGEETRPLEALFLQDRLTGRFEIISEIHRAGCACVFLAQDLLLERHIILKSLRLPISEDPEFQTRWLQNAKRAIRLDHPNVLRHFTLGAAGPLNYFISEYCQHATLDRYILQKKRLPVWEALRIIRDIARGVQAAHNLGLCHHRLKPANIACHQDGLYQVMDFGSAQGLVFALQNKPWSTRTESIVYLAPEQIEAGISDTHSDQYTMALILHEMLTGRLPFRDSDDQGAIERLSGQLPSIADQHPGLSIDLQNILFKSLAVNPADRYENCDAFIEALESLDPEYWAPRYELDAGQMVSLGQFLSDAHKSEKNRDFRKAVLFAEQAMLQAPYDTTVTDLLARLRKRLELANDVRSLIHKGISAFYEQRLDTAITVLNRARQIDKDNPEVVRIIHEVLQEQERTRLATVLIEAASMDIKQNALTQAMSKIVKILDIDPGNKKALALKDQIEVAMEDKATLSILISQAEDAFQEERMDEAVEFLSKILKIDSKNSEALHLFDQVKQLRKVEKVLELKGELEESLRGGDFDRANEIISLISKHDEKAGKELLRKIDEWRLKQTIHEDADIQEQADSATPPETKLEIPAVHDEDKSPEISLQESEQIPLEALKSDQPVEVESQTDFKPALELRIEPETPISRDLAFSLNPERRNRSSLAVIAGGILALVFLIIIASSAFRNLTKRESTNLITSPTHMIPTAAPPPSLTPTPTKSPLPTMTTTPIMTKQPTFSDPIASALKEGAEFEANDDFEAALRKYEEVLKRNKSNIEAQSGLARCNRKLKNSEKTQTLTEAKVEQAVEAHPPPFTAKPTEPAFTFTAKPTAFASPLPPVQSPVHTSTQPPPPTQLQETPKEKPQIINITFSPNPPIRNHALKIVLTFEASTGKTVQTCWIHYRQHGEKGFHQISALAKKSTCRLEIPSTEIIGDEIQIYASGLDSEGNEILYRSASDPIFLKISSEVYVPVNPL